MTESKDAIIEKNLTLLLEHIWYQVVKNHYVSHTMISRIAFEHARWYSLTMAFGGGVDKEPERRLSKAFKNYFIEFMKKTFTTGQILKEYTHITETSKDFDYKKVEKHVEDLKRELRGFFALEQRIEEGIDLDS